ncbi:MAG: PHP domain-containing protein [Clostridia bacterium]|nr:PHP domain-containing protein [Clostridia bacterium]
MADCKPRIDFHMHSTVSDGTDAPGQVLSKVADAGIEVFSITDHDAVKAADVIKGLLKEGSPRFIPGVEFSCRDEKGKYHILGYGFDPHGESVQRIVSRGHSIRMNKVKARLDGLKAKMGIVFPKEEISRLLSLDNPGKPHIGNLLVKYGYTDDREKAIKNFLDPIRVNEGFIRPEEAIEGVLGSGGVPVLAHPFYGSGDELILGDEMDERLRRLMGYGLSGIEGYYSGFSDKLRGEALSLAEKYDLYVTAGSDYHGDNKNLVLLGDTGLSENEEYPAGLVKFLERVEAI